MSPVQFTKPAKRDLKDIAGYIAQDNPLAAKRFVARLQEVCRTTLVRFPDAGTMRDDLAAGLRCFSVGNYIIYFRSRNPVVIVRVLHGARDVTSTMFG